MGFPGRAPCRRNYLTRFEALFGPRPASPGLALGRHPDGRRRGLPSRSRASPPPRPAGGFGNRLFFARSNAAVRAGLGTFCWCGMATSVVPRGRRTPPRQAAEVRRFSSATRPLRRPSAGNVAAARVGRVLLERPGRAGGAFRRGEAADAEAAGGPDNGRGDRIGGPSPRRPDRSGSTATFTPLASLTLEPGHEKVHVLEDLAQGGAVDGN